MHGRRRRASARHFPPAEHPFAPVPPVAEQSPAISTDPQFATFTGGTSTDHFPESQSATRVLIGEAESSELHAEHSSHLTLDEGQHVEQQYTIPQQTSEPSHPSQRSTPLVDNTPDATSDPHSPDQILRAFTALSQNIGSGSRKSYTIQTKIRVAEVGLAKGRNIAAKEFGLNGSMVGRWMRSIDTMRRTIADTSENFQENSEVAKPAISDGYAQQQALASTQRRRLPDGTSMVSGGRKRMSASSRRDSKDSEFSAESTATLASASTSTAAAQRELRKRRGSSLPKVATKRRVDIAADSNEAPIGVQEPGPSQTNPLLETYFPNNLCPPPLVAPAEEPHQQSEFRRIQTSYEGQEMPHLTSETPHSFPAPVSLTDRGEDAVYLPQMQPTQQYFQQPPLLFRTNTHLSDPQRSQQVHLHPSQTNRGHGQESSLAMSTAYLDSPRRPQVMQARWRVLETVNSLSNAVREYNREESNDTGLDASDWREALSILRNAMESALAIIRRGEGSRSSGP
ncbi:hypothetical protein HDU82_008646 [Entophlyctis luteolus]|nr:hypothetical protein HDU82_008646 [Entophlyctis luteolus]